MSSIQLIWCDQNLQKPRDVLKQVSIYCSHLRERCNTAFPVAPLKCSVGCKTLAIGVRR